MKEYIDKQELIRAIHDIYAGQLYCKEDMCNSEIVGYDCDDCIKGCISKTVESFKTYTQEEIVNEYAKEENGYLAASCEIIGYKKALDDLKKYADKELDIRFSLDILCRQVIEEYIEEKKKELE